MPQWASARSLQLSQLKRYLIMTLIDLTPTPEETKLLAEMLATGFTIDQLKKEDKPRKEMLEEYQEETN